MPYWLILDKATGRRVSESSTPPGSLPGNLEAVEIAKRPDDAVEEWDAIQRKLVAKSVAAKPLAALKGLTALTIEQQGQALLALVDHFGLRS